MPQQQITPEQVDELHKRFLAKPEDFVTDVLGSKPWQKQTEIIQSTFKYPRTAVKTCNAIGKSYIGARIVVTYLMLNPGSVVVTTAPTWRQVTDVLWREIGTALKKSLFPLTDVEATQAGLNLDTDWFAVGLSTSKPENFFGYHADNILVVVDEAGGVDERIFEGVAAITPNKNAKVLLIGNPTSPGGTFYDAFNKPELGYNCITVSAFDTPNFTDTGITNLEKLLKVFTAPPSYTQADWIMAVNKQLDKRSNKTYTGLISPERVFSRYHEWGEDSSAWQALIMGEFPTQGDQALIPTNLVSMAMNMGGVDKASGKTFAELSGWTIPDGPERYGQDMARFGNDKNVMTPRHGGWVRKQVKWSKIDLMASADQIINVVDVTDPLGRINIDDTGNGGGTTDRIMQKSRENVANGHPAYAMRLVAYNMSSKDRMIDPIRFHDVTSEMYWNLRDWFMKKKIAFEAFDQNLFDQLVGRRWFVNRSGKIQVESKDDYRDRTKKDSPDESDSLALAFAGEKPSGEYHDVKTKQDNYYDDKMNQVTEDRPLTADLQEQY